jgi:thiamine pyrophosphate-dependent acetolactate synthase large subunit-like protein
VRTSPAPARNSANSLASAVGAARAVEDGRTLVLAAGDGGFLMGLSDLEPLIGAARSAIVVIYNDAAYGAEIHQYGSQGLTEKPMLIPEVDFSGVARALGAESAVIRSIGDLSALQHWIVAGAQGTFVADCRITSSVRAPWLTELRFQQDHGDNLLALPPRKR